MNERRDNDHLKQSKFTNPVNPPNQVFCDPVFIAALATMFSAVG